MQSPLSVAEKEIPSGNSELPAISRTLGDDELELKFELQNGERGTEQTREILAAVNRFGIIRGQKRRELHSVFANEGEEHAYHVIMRPDSPKTHVKKKAHGRRIQSPNGLCILLRHEEHWKHSGDDAKKWKFAELLSKMLMSTQPIGRFEKHAVDLDFAVDDLAFALTVSIAKDLSTDQPAMIQQAEIEYLGHIDGKLPRRGKILETFDKIAKPLSGKLLKSVSTRTKLEWLLDRREGHPWEKSLSLAADADEQLVL